MSQTIANQAPLALIIEDDYNATVIFEQALQAAGFTTKVARDGETALRHLDTTTPLLICLDLHLPRISGVTLLRKIQANERLADTPVMLLTADPSLAETLRTEVDLILLKPIGFRQLRDLAIRLRPPSSQS